MPRDAQQHEVGPKSQTLLYHSEVVQGQAFWSGRYGGRLGFGRATDAAELEETYCRKSGEEKNLSSSGLGPDLCRNASAQKKERVTANLTLTATQYMAALRFGEKFSLARAMLTNVVLVFVFDVFVYCSHAVSAFVNMSHGLPCGSRDRILWACVGLTHIDRASLFWVLSISSLVSVFVESSWDLVDADVTRADRAEPQSTPTHAVNSACDCAIFSRVCHVRA